MVITKEETFGPVAPLYRFKSEDDAVKMANDTEFGLASYFYSCDIGSTWRVAEALEYGIEEFLEVKHLNTSACAASTAELWTRWGWRNPQSVAPERDHELPQRYG